MRLHGTISPDLPRSFDVVSDNEYLTGILARILYASSLACQQLLEEDVEVLASALCVSVLNHEVKPVGVSQSYSLNRGSLGPQQIAETSSIAIAQAIKASSPTSAGALLDFVKEASKSFQDEFPPFEISSNRHFVTGLVLTFMMMVLEVSPSLKTVTASLSGQRTVAVKLDQLAKIDVEYLIQSKPFTMMQLFSAADVSSRETFIAKLQEWGQNQNV